MKVFISQLMKDKTPEEITAQRDAAIKNIIRMGIQSATEMIIINSYFSDYDPNKDLPGVVSVPLAYLAESLKLLATADAAYFCEGWDKGRGTILEHEACKQYGIRILCD